MRIRRWSLALVLSLLTVMSLFSSRAEGLPPTPVTSPATAITDQLAKLNGALTSIGNGTVGIPVTMRQFAHNRCGSGTTCSAVFPAPTLAGATLVLFAACNGGCNTPTDDGGNSYSGWAVGDVAGSQLFQLAGAGVSDEPDGIVLYGATISVTTINVPHTGNPAGVFIAELSKLSTPYHTTMTLITNTPPTVYGVSVNNSYGFIIGDLEMNAAAGNCGSFQAYEGAINDTYEGPTLTFECSHLMTNFTGGTRLSVTNVNGIRSYNAIQIQAQFAATVGFLWGTAANLAGATNVTVGVVFVTGAFSSSLTGLSSVTVYYFQAWGNSSSGFANGTILSFTTGQSMFNLFAALNVLGFVIVMTMIVSFALYVKLRRDGSIR